MYKDVLNFWFEEIDESKWWIKDLEFDQCIIERFATTHDMAAKCELFEWRRSAEGRLAEIIVLDQFSRNMFRDSPKAFVNDPLALVLSQEAVLRGTDRELDPKKRSFLYLPYMHSESRIVHEVAVKLFNENGVRSNIEFEIKHKKIIDRFGRYPHRNEILDRESTQEEIEFLKGPGSSF